MKKIIFLCSFVISLYIMSVNAFAYTVDLDVKHCEYIGCTSYAVSFCYELEWTVTPDEGEDLSEIEVPQEYTKEFMRVWSEGKNSQNLSYEARYNYKGTSSDTAWGLKPDTIYYYQVTGSDEINSFKTPPDDEPTVFVTCTYENQGYVYKFNCNNLTAGEDKIFIALFKDEKCVKVYTKLYDGTDISFDNISSDYDYSKIFIWNKDSLSPIAVSRNLFKNFTFTMLFKNHPPKMFLDGNINQNNYKN